MEMIRCSNCFGTGTVFRRQSRSLKPGGAKCPVCEGATKVPAPTQEQTPAHLHGAQRVGS